MRLLVYLFVLLGFVATKSARAETILEQLEQARPLFDRIGRNDVLDAFLHRVEVLPVTEFIARFENASHQRRLGSGVEGVVVKDRDNFVWKISHGVSESIGRVIVKERDGKISDDEKARLKREWSAISASTRLPPRGYFFWKEKRRWPFKNASFLRELVGSLLWSIYSPISIDLPTVISSDGYGYRGSFIEGPTFDKILRDYEKTGETRYDLKSIWKQLCLFQRQNERLLRETGFVVDLFSPANMLVRGTEAAPVLVPIDHSVSRPAEEPLAWLRDEGIVIVDPAIEHFEMWKKIWVVTPFLVTNRLWHIDYDLAVDYVAEYFQTRTRKSAEERLARLHVWQSPSQNNITDPKYILRAREITGVAPAKTRIKLRDNYRCAAALIGAKRL